jgi:hypothetical protein
MHDLAALLTALGSGLCVVGAVVGGVAGSDDHTRRPAEARGRVRARLVGRYQAHPRLVTVQICCLGAAVILLIAALVLLLT